MSEPAFHITPIDERSAELVAEVFRAAYGDSCPVQYVYHADSILKEIQQKRLSAALAVDDKGRPAGYVSVFKSAPNPKLWEAGNLVVVPEYKQTHVSTLLVNSYINGALYEKDASDGLFGEAVCCHYFTQVSSIKGGHSAFALELDQLDGPSFKDNRTGSTRVSCVLHFLENTAPCSPVYVPEPYAQILNQLVRPLHARKLIPSTALLPSGMLTRQEDKYYESAQTWKVAAWEIGSDWPVFIADLRAEAARRSVISLQVTLNMACPHIGAAVQVLRSQGFFLGGIAPRWFGSDGLLMQQVLGVETEYEHIKLYSSTAKELLGYIRADRASISAGTGT